MIIAVVPALDEEVSVPSVITALRSEVDVVVVVDNGSKDQTASVARRAGAIVVSEPRRGYGYACLAGIRRAKELGATTVLFLDADGSDDPREAKLLLEPVLTGQADLVLGVRTRLRANRASMAPVQRFGNWFAPWLMRAFLGAPYHDMPPYKAVGASVLDRLPLTDTGYGFTIGLLIHAHARGCRIQERDVSCRARLAGQSKVSGTLRGSTMAAARIISSIAKHAYQARRNSRQP
jgi:glycosyltransferase involved in cell wall biosynthesis